MSKTYLGDVLSPGVKFTHDYDFGSTTSLKLEVMDEYNAFLHRTASKIELMARNDPPVISCDKCSEPAVWVSSEWFWRGEGWVCEKHKDEYDEEMLPVVNSPRVGVCAYGW